MEITKTSKSFHLKAIELKARSGQPRQSWQQCEYEYFMLTGKNRYKSFESFNADNCAFKKRNKIKT